MLRTFFMLWCVIPVCNSIAQSCIIRGNVKEYYNIKALPGANVRSAKNPNAGVTTDREGAFQITLAATDTLIISYIGFEEQRIPFDDIVNCKVNAHLKQAEQMIQEIEIKAEQLIAEEFTIYKIRKLDIYTNPSAKADPLLAVNSTPSATTIDESATVSLRGGSPAETGIFLNNVPINDAVRYSQLNGIGTFSIFNTALVSNVTVYPGNPPLEYGNSTSGVIALQTDETIPQKPINTLSLTLASLGGYSARKLDKYSSLTVFTNYQPSFFIRTLNYNALEKLKFFSSGDLGLHYYRKFRGNAIVKLFNYSMAESYEFQYDQPSYSGLFIQNKIRNFTVGNIRKRIGKKSELSFNQGISFSRATYKYGTTDIHLSLNDFFSSVNFLRTGESSEWKTGLSYERKSSDFNGVFPTFEYASGEHHPVTTASSQDRVTNPELYAYYKYYINDRWIAGVGLRKNIVIEKLEDYLSIQGNLNYDLNDKMKLTLSAGKYHKFQLPQGETAMPFAIRSFQYSIDMSTSGKKIKNSFSVFHKRSMQGLKNTTVKGLECFTKYQFNTNLRFQVSLTSLDAEEFLEKVTKPSPYNIHYFIRGNIEYKIRGTWTITSVFLFRQGSYYYRVLDRAYDEHLMVYSPINDTIPERLPSYNTIDVSISKIFPLTSRSVAIAFVSAGNIVNWKNIRDYTYNFDYTIRKDNLFSQRTFYFGLIVNF